MICLQRTKLISLPSEGVTLPMKDKYNQANRAIKGEEDHLAEMEDVAEPSEFIV